MNHGQVSKAIARTLESIAGLLSTAQFLAREQGDDVDRARYFGQVAETVAEWANDYWRDGLTAVPEEDLPDPTDPENLIVEPVGRRRPLTRAAGLC